MSTLFPSSSDRTQSLAEQSFGFSTDCNPSSLDEQALQSLDFARDAVEDLLQSKDSTSESAIESTHESIFTMDMFYWSKRADFPSLLLKHLSLVLHGECSLYEVTALKAKRVGAKAPIVKSPTIQKTEQRLAIEAASTKSISADILDLVDAFPSAIAKELSDQSQSKFSAAIAFPIEHTNQHFVLVETWDNSVERQTVIDDLEVLRSESEWVSLLLSMWQQSQSALSSTRRKRILSKLTTKPFLIATSAIMVGIFLMPVPYLPKRTCTIEPSFRYHVSAPVDGTLMESFVRPGESVNEGDLLAKLDDKQLLRDLAVASADYEAASKRREIALAMRTGGDLRLAQLEQQQADLTIRSIRAKLEKTEIRSPKSGVVIQGDWTTHIGAPVKLGDGLFEVCSPGDYTAKVELTSDDLENIHVGCNVVLCNGTFSEYITGSITRIEPKAQVVDDKCVFYAEVQLDTQSDSLRPGLKIDAKLKPAWKSIGWQIFHRPYQWFANLWVW